MAARDPRTLDLDASQPTAPAQLSGSAGVGEGVSSVAMEGGALAGIAPAGRVRASAPVAVTPYERVSDAEVMLRVKAGENAAFDFHSGEYRPHLLGFMYRQRPKPAEG